MNTGIIISNSLSSKYVRPSIVFVKVWSDRLSDQRIRREPNELSCTYLVDSESNHDVRSIVCMV